MTLKLGVYTYKLCRLQTRIRKQFQYNIIIVLYNKCEKSEEKSTVDSDESMLQLYTITLWNIQNVVHQAISMDLKRPSWKFVVSPGLSVQFNAFFKMC